MKTILLAATATLALASAAHAQDPHAGHAMGGMAPEAPAEYPLGALPHQMTSALGPFPMSRDGSGTAWLPDASPHMGAMGQHGEWMTMSHALLNVVYSDQGGPRGDDKAFLAGMVMGMAQRPLGAGTLGLRAMLSPDPFMGAKGYPLLLAAGESADGKTPIIDRQHPHDLFMELSASYSLPVGEDGSVFLYAGLPGEPAYGPASFMHRLSSLDSPEAPITHHWLDSTHITFGVLTAGYTQGAWKLEASRFRGREPDEKRYDIETGALDSTAARVSWNAGANWSLQASWADIKSPEALEPHHDETRYSASAAYVRSLDNGGLVAVTLAASQKNRQPGPILWGYLAEAAWMPNDAWTVFGRAEQIDADELSGGHGAPPVTVGKISVGVVRDWTIRPGVKLGLGGLVSGFDIPGALGASYGEPSAGMVFVRLKVG
ncbi:MAG: hypothetical protein WA047_12205 [Phenylobacterium sp.]|uniref:hypothetical protein n=1 Tax=Phenylobacterium sp. TaxID=1871053 RepID=UPI003BB7CE23